MIALRDCGLGVSLMIMVFVIAIILCVVGFRRGRRLLNEGWFYGLCILPVFIGVLATVGAQGRIAWLIFSDSVNERAKIVGLYDYSWFTTQFGAFLSITLYCFVLVALWWNQMKNRSQ